MELPPSSTTYLPRQRPRNRGVHLSRGWIGWQPTSTGALCKYNHCWFGFEATHAPCHLLHPKRNTRASHLVSSKKAKQPSSCWGKVKGTCRLSLEPRPNRSCLSPLSFFGGRTDVGPRLSSQARRPRFPCPNSLVSALGGRGDRCTRSGHGEAVRRHLTGTPEFPRKIRNKS